MIVPVALTLLALVVALALAAGKHVPGRDLRFANPIVIPTAFVIIVLLDFLYMGFDAAPELWGAPVVADGMAAAWVCLTYGVLILALYCGVLLGLRISPSASFKPRDTNEFVFDTTAAGWLAIIFGAVSFVLFLQEVLSGASLAQISAQKALLSSSNRALPIVTWMAVIATGYYLSTSQAGIKHLAMVWLIASIAAGATGVRSHLITLTVFFLSALARRRKGPGIAALPYVVVAGFVLLTFLRFVRASAVREIRSLGEFLEYQGGPLKTIFGSAEMASAEIASLATRWSETVQAPRFPGEGLAGLVLGMMPRALFDWKPLPASTEFTTFVAPTVTTSQLVIGSPMELMVELGITGATVAALCIGVLYGALIMRAAKLSPQAYFAYPALALGALVFLRTDIANMGVYLWPLLFFVIVHKMVRATCFPKTRRRSEPDGVRKKVVPRRVGPVGVVPGRRSRHPAA